MYRQAFFPRTSPHWRRLVFQSAAFLPGTRMGDVISRDFAFWLRVHFPPVLCVSVNHRIPVENHLGLPSPLLLSGTASPAGRHSDRAIHQRESSQSLQSEFGAVRNTYECVVRRSWDIGAGQWDSAVWMYLRGGIFCVCIDLELQVLLHVRLPHRYHRWGMRRGMSRSDSDDRRGV